MNPSEDRPDESGNVTVDFGKLSEISKLWVRRVSVFMGIGTNAAHVEPPLPHSLDDHMQYHFVPQNPSPEQQRHYADEFEVWVIASGLRDLIEGHSLFLDAAYAPALLINRGRMEVVELRKLAAEFEGLNVSRKRETLHRELGGSDLFQAMFASMVKARNCMAHRNGLVGQQDVNTDAGHFEMTWRFQGLVHVEKDRRIDLNRRPDDNYFEKGATLGLKLVDERRGFPMGAQIRLTRHDLAEICFAFTAAAETIVARMAELAKEKSIPTAAKVAPVD